MICAQDKTIQAWSGGDLSCYQTSDIERDSSEVQVLRRQNFRNSHLKQERDESISRTHRSMANPSSERSI